MNLKQALNNTVLEFLKTEFNIEMGDIVNGKELVINNERINNWLIHDENSTFDEVRISNFKFDQYTAEKIFSSRLNDDHTSLSLELYCNLKNKTGEWSKKNTYLASVRFFEYKK